MCQNNAVLNDARRNVKLQKSQSIFWSFYVESLIKSSVNLWPSHLFHRRIPNLPDLAKMATPPPISLTCFPITG
jgi:hypothetical protein